MATHGRGGLGSLICLGNVAHPASAPYAAPKSPCCWSAPRPVSPSSSPRRIFNGSGPATVRPRPADPRVRERGTRRAGMKMDVLIGQVMAQQRHGHSRDKPLACKSVRRAIQQRTAMLAQTDKSPILPSIAATATSPGAQAGSPVEHRTSSFSRSLASIVSCASSSCARASSSGRRARVSTRPVDGPAPRCVGPLDPERPPSPPHTRAAAIARAPGRGASRPIRRDRAQFVAHAPDPDHSPSERGRPLRSLSAPVVGCPKTSSSAALPPSMTASRPSKKSFG